MVTKVPRFNRIRCFLICSIGLYLLLQYNLTTRHTDVDDENSRHPGGPSSLLLGHHHNQTTSTKKFRVTTRQQQQPWIDEERISSVDYFACCGAGHRLSKLADANYVAKQLKFSLRVFFGFCNNQEVYSYLFRPQPLTKEFLVGGTPDMYIKFSNEVPGYKKIVRQQQRGNTTTSSSSSNSSSMISCPCFDNDHRFEADIELFNSIRDRFRDQEKIDNFRRDNNFLNHTVIGLHIRAGNGERGDFIRKNRTIQDINAWCQHMADLLVDMSNDFTDPPILFIATDTVHIISKLQTMLKDKMDVIYLAQDRLVQGEGVLFGAYGSVNDNGDECLNGWLDSFTDMILLSHADIVVAGRPSSFTQSLPMTLALSKNKSERKVKKSFCEVNLAATSTMCFEDLKDWCCNGDTSFSLQSIQKYEYRKIPKVSGLNLEEYTKMIKMRPRLLKDCISTPDSYKDCLPYIIPKEENISKLRKRGQQ
jgi:hypothetical protein